MDDYCKLAFGIITVKCIADMVVIGCVEWLMR